MPRLHPPLAPGSSQPWIIVFLGWLNPRFNGETRPGKAAKKSVLSLNQPPNHLCFLVTNAGFNARAPC